MIRAIAAKAVAHLRNGRRRQPRLFVGGEAIIATQDGRMRSVQLRDRSELGFGVQNSGGLQVGEKVRVILVTCEYLAEVAWRNGEDCGLRILAQVVFD